MLGRMNSFDATVKHRSKLDYLTHMRDTLAAAIIELPAFPQVVIKVQEDLQGSELHAAVGCTSHLSAILASTPTRSVVCRKREKPRRVNTDVFLFGEFHDPRP
jgi:hypothetical protein